MIYYDKETDWFLLLIGLTPSGEYFELKNVENGNTSFYPLEDMGGLVIAGVK
jgi:hypothetical protein